MGPGRQRGWIWSEVWVTGQRLFDEYVILPAAAGGLPEVARSILGIPSPTQQAIRGAVRAYFDAGKALAEPAQASRPPEGKLLPVTTGWLGGRAVPRFAGRQPARKSQEAVHRLLGWFYHFDWCPGFAAGAVGFAEGLGINPRSLVVGIGVELLIHSIPDEGLAAYGYAREALPAWLKAKLPNVNDRRSLDDWLERFSRSFLVSFLKEGCLSLSPESLLSDVVFLLECLSGILAVAAAAQTGQVMLLFEILKEAVWDPMVVFYQQVILSTEQVQAEDFGELVGSVVYHLLVTIVLTILTAVIGGEGGALGIARLVTRFPKYAKALQQLQSMVSKVRRINAQANEFNPCRAAGRAAFRGVARRLGRGRPASGPSSPIQPAPAHEAQPVALPGHEDPKKKERIAALALAMSRGTTPAQAEVRKPRLPKKKPLEAVERRGIPSRKRIAPNGREVTIYNQPRADTARTHGHQRAIERQVDEMVRSGEYRYITIELAWRTATGRVNPRSDRPDIIGVRWDSSRVDAWEVRSSSQDAKEMRAKLERGRNDLPAQYQGRIRVIEPRP